MYVEDYKKGDPVVIAKLDAAPKPILEALFYYDAFQKLAADRPPAMAGLAMIPNRAIFDYAEFLKLDEEEINNLFYIIREIDTHYINLVNKKAAAANKQGG